MKENRKAMIVSLNKTTFKNEKTGEVKEMCCVTYIMPHEETENSYGNNVFENYVAIEFMEPLKKYVLRPNNDLVLSKIALKNGEKFRLEKFADISFRK